MWTSATKIDALSKFRGHSPIKLVHEGFVCGQDLRQVPSISTPTKSKALGCHASKEYNSSSVDKFITFMQQAKSWKDINFVAAQGGCIRKLVTTLTRRHHLNPVAFIEHKRKNLFIVQIQLAGKIFFLVRHCARQYQKHGDCRR